MTVSPFLPPYHHSKFLYHMGEKNSIREDIDQVYDNGKLYQYLAPSDCGLTSTVLVIICILTFLCTHMILSAYTCQITQMFSAAHNQGYFITDTARIWTHKLSNHRWRLHQEHSNTSECIFPFLVLPEIYIYINKRTAFINSLINLWLFSCNEPIINILSYDNKTVCHASVHVVCYRMVYLI